MLRRYVLYGVGEWVQVNHHYPVSIYHFLEFPQFHLCPLLAVYLPQRPGPTRYILMRPVLLLHPTQPLVRSLQDRLLHHSCHHLRPFATRTLVLHPLLLLYETWMERSLCQLVLAPSRSRQKVQGIKKVLPKDCFNMVSVRILFRSLLPL